MSARRTSSCFGRTFRQPAQVRSEFEALNPARLS